MGRLNQIFKCVRKRGRIIFYTLCLSCLVSIAVWDVTNIIGDYIFDNRMASARIVYQQNCSPILQIDPIVTLNFNTKKSLFIETWSMNDSEFESIRRKWVHRRDFCDGDRKRYNNFTLQEKLDIAQLYDFVWNDKGNYNDETINQIARDHGLSRSEFDKTIDAFSKNPQCIEKLLQNVWDEVKINFVRPTDGGGVEVGSFGRTVTAFRLNLRRDLRNIMKDGYELDRRLKNKKNMDDKNIYTYGAFFTILFPESYEHIGGIGDGRWADITVQITNIGVFDRIEFPPCTREYKTKEECLNNLTAHTVSDVCHCIPFTDRAWFNNETGRGEIPYCTMKHYNVCRELAKNESIKRQDLASDSCRPCVVTKNNYFVLVQDPPVWYEDPSEWHNRVLLSFTCLDQFHTYYREKQQNSFPQMVSQVGGDLGLYIGFSMFSVLSLFLFLYGLYRQRASKSYDVTDRPIPLPYSIQFALQYTTYAQNAMSGGGVRDYLRKNNSAGDSMVHDDYGREIEKLKKTVDELYDEIKTLSRNNAPAKANDQK